MCKSKLEYNISIGLKNEQKSRHFPDKSIIDDDKFLSSYVFTDNDFRIFNNWITVIMEVKEIDTNKSFFIPCILRKVPEQIDKSRTNDVCYGEYIQYSSNTSYIEDLEISMNEKYIKILAENNFLESIYCENGNLKTRPKYFQYKINNTTISSINNFPDPKKCNLAFYPFDFSMFAYTCDSDVWDYEMKERGIINDESFQEIKRLSKQYFTIDDVNLGIFISTLQLNERYYIGHGPHTNVIMKCKCNSLSLVFYDNTTLSVDEIENHSITINENDPNFNKAYTLDKQIKELNKFFDDECHKSEIKKEENKNSNKLNIVITNDELLI